MSLCVNECVRACRLTAICRAGFLLSILLILAPTILLAGQLTQVQNLATSDGAKIDNCGPPRVFQYETDIISQNSCRFQARFRSMLAVDRRALGGTYTIPRQSTHTVSFKVDVDGPTEPWTVRVHHRRRGTVIIDDDDGRCGRADLSPISAIISGGTPSGSLNTSMLYTRCNCNDCSGDCDPGDSCSGNQSSNYAVTVDDSKQTDITGFGDQIVTIDFTWDSEVKSIVVLGGGDEACVRLGLTANGTDWFDNCDDIIDAAYYTPGQDGHLVTVELMSDEPEVVLTSEPTMCAPVWGGEPCTYHVSGIINGCVGDNYTVFLQYLDSFNNVVCSTTVPVTDGNKTWISELTCPGPCTAVGLNYWAENDAGLRYGDDPELVASIGPVSNARVVVAEFCGPLVPTLSEWGMIAVGVLLLGLGAVIMLRRSNGSPPA